ncbi:Methylated-DNA--protein-cysteine methyltransferase [Posidoniimonas polymericola]|uniref:methylated-DNA--[protein]-cysteine S-methyltransferase n=1 Tax=Posidoniimonas polymericola TaxID=2528002 RepID=A0A5C5XWC4_9BACT|nr:MGMT family protein [Posidoniimonas polymericola]TWT67637.1 Methylated-DNA--protein-cysteine methyltransferase [Posidoniimonas polymericola]
MPIVTIATCTACFSTDLGWLALSASLSDDPHDTWANTPGGSPHWRLERLAFGHRRSSDARRALGPNDTRLQSDPPGEVRGWMDQLQRYAAGEPVALESIPVDRDHLTEFGQRVSRLCSAIGYGATLSYGELAKRAGRPGAARAVGSVMSGNRTPLVVPCHRVLGSGGRLGGFSAPQGVAMKRQLLEMEGARMS